MFLVFSILLHEELDYLDEGGNNAKSWTWNRENTCSLSKRFCDHSCTIPIYPIKLGEPVCSLAN